MSDWREGRWAAFDIESTGVDVNTARIVTAAVVTTTDVADTYRQVLINPGVPIPAEATAVHGITTEHARDEGVDPAEGVRWIDERIRELWRAGVPLVVYNAPYDLTLLDRECRRHLGRPFEVIGPVIDPLVIDKAVDTYRRGSRKLVDTCRHYGVSLDADDAHGAEADATAALNLARRMLQGWDDADLRQLYRDQRTWYRQQRESFAAYLARQGKTLDNASTAWPMREVA